MRALHDVPAPAKLNLFLHVTGRRPDGYHLLQSIFMLLDWHDTLHFFFGRHSSGIGARRLTADIDNGCARAYHVFSVSDGAINRSKPSAIRKGIRCDV